MLQLFCSHSHARKDYAVCIRVRSNSVLIVCEHYREAELQFSRRANEDPLGLRYLRKEFFLIKTIAMHDCEDAFVVCCDQP